MVWARKILDGGQYFENESGKKSKKFYWTWDYSCGYAVVQENLEDSFRYRDVNGNLSGKFYYAGDYSCNFALVQKWKTGLYQYRDLDGNLSADKFAVAHHYIDGFAEVQRLAEGPAQYRDMLGRVTDERTEEGYDFYDFTMGRIGGKSLIKKYPHDKELITAVESELARRAESDFKNDEVYGV